jgi:hypothetical protein
MEYDALGHGPLDEPLDYLLDPLDYLVGRQLTAPAKVQRRPRPPPPAAPAARRGAIVAPTGTYDSVHLRRTMAASGRAAEAVGLPVASVGGLEVEAVVSESRLGGTTLRIGPASPVRARTEGIRRQFLLPEHSDAVIGAQ